MKLISVAVLLTLSVVAGSYAYWAGELRDRQLRRMERWYGKESRMFRIQSRWMGASYVFSFRLVGSLAALVLLGLAIYVAIHD